MGKKIAIIAVLNVILVAGHSFAIFEAHRLGMSREDLTKLLPIAVATLLSQLITLTIALSQALKKRGIDWSLTGDPEVWDILLTVSIFNNEPCLIRVLALSARGYTTDWADSPVREVGPFTGKDLKCRLKVNEAKPVTSSKKYLDISVNYRLEGKGEVVKKELSLRNPFHVRSKTAERITH
jgi:hypothetical protein